MNEFHKGVLGMVLVPLLTSCSAVDRQNFCTGTTIGSAGGWNPFAIPCIANTAVEMASNMTTSESSSGVANERPQAFKASDAVNKQISANTEFMQFVLDSQSRYRSGDYGDSKQDRVGLYASAVPETSIVIFDNFDEWAVFFQREYKP